ncbi:hypothetical protein B0H13DRAFT_1888086 [Mycena leptocephala]|nr:hypothetical protein B0H13DRAFT_1888086 [Mycena leptocephala]
MCEFDVGVVLGVIAWSRVTPTLMSTTNASLESPAPILVSQQQLLQLKRERLQVKTRERMAECLQKIKSRSRPVHTMLGPVTVQRGGFKPGSSDAAKSHYTSCNMTTRLTVRRKSPKTRRGGRESESVPQA